MHPAVVKDMTEAAETPVSVLELDRRCSEIIAKACGAETALITTGITGGLALAAAGCAMRTTELVKYDPWEEPLYRPAKGRKAEWLPLVQKQFHNPSEIKGFKGEVVIPLGHESIYNLPLFYGSLKPVWAGTKERCTEQELESKITNDTAAVFFSGEMMYFHDSIPEHARGHLSGVAPVITTKPYQISLEKIIEVSHKHDVPIIMDCAYTIPPAENLKKWIKMGVDIACYSGGKSVCGPNDTGFDVGRKDLLKLAACHRFPYHGLGRGLKVDKTQMVALTKAVQMYPKLVESDMKGATKVAKWLVTQLSKLPHVESVTWKIAEMGMVRPWPIVCLKLNEQTLGITTKDVINLLYDSNPSIWVYGYDIPHCCPGAITLCTQTLYHGTRKFPGNERIVFKRFKEILTKKR